MKKYGTLVYMLKVCNHFEMKRADDLLGRRKQIVRQFECLQVVLERVTNELNKEYGQHDLDLTLKSIEDKITTLCKQGNTNPMTLSLLSIIIINKHFNCLFNIMQCKLN